MAADKRKVRFGGIEYEAIDLNRILRMRESGELGNEAEFWSQREKRWMPIVAMMTDFEVYQDERIKSLMDARIQFVRVVGCGADDEDCPSCRALTDKVFPTSEAPTLPPPGCTCIPWCRCLVLAEE